MKKILFILCLGLLIQPLFAVASQSKKVASVTQPKDWEDLTFAEFIDSPMNQKFMKGYQQSNPSSFSSKNSTEVKGSKKSRQISSENNLSKLSSDYKENEPFLLIRDPALLEELEKQGFSFYSHFGFVTGKPVSDYSNLQEFYKDNANYRFIARTTEQDLNELLKSETEKTKSSKVPLVGIGMKFARRIFDANWFQSPIARFELIGIVNRLDRADFDVKTCGETRFIYRLSYQSVIGTYSRMPLTIMVKYINSGSAVDDRQSCKDYARTWIYPSDKQNNQELINWLKESGPLQSRLRLGQPHSFEMNIQAMRIPSAARPDLAGHGTYLLRSFAVTKEGQLEEGYLENTPNVDAFKKKPELKVEFLEQFKDRHFVNRLSEGILKLDNKYLAKKAWSYSPYGIARQENRLFDQFITEEDLKKINFNQSDYVRSARAAIMRLNDYSCVGCHQARAHAGFHFLGVDKEKNHPLNSLFFEGSGHFELELKRRKEYMSKIYKNLQPDPRRDFSISPGEVYDDGKVSTIQFKKSGYGHFCGLNNGPFMHWQCEDNLSCQSLDEAEGQNILGKCFPATSLSGDPILKGVVMQNDHNSDKLVIKTQMNCGGSEAKVFETFLNKGGFPSGICHRKDCQNIGKNNPNEVCGDAVGDGFNSCVASTAAGKITFSDCLTKTIKQYGSARCSEFRSCRNDFVCARSSLDKNVGYCTPSYFLFQVRLDGHADPIKGR